jgi:phosphatidate cytidylyltransferase
MLRERTAVALMFLPLVMWVISEGRALFAVAITLILCLAVYEYGALFQNRGSRPARPLMVAGVALIAVSRSLAEFEWGAEVLGALCLAAMVWHLVDYERGAPGAGSDFAVTLSGMIYIGWIGSYLISLRELPGGTWWFMTALSAVWLADSGAYMIGSILGRHRMTPRLSPKKTWEGYFGGVVCGALGASALVALWRLGADASSALDMNSGLFLGAVIAALSPLGDLGISMFKREFKVKDTGTLLAGHGGSLDRIDSWLWAGVLGYYLALWLTLQPL